MKKFNLFAIGVVAMLMAAVNVSAARVNYKALTKLEEDNLVTISSNRDELTYTLIAL